MFSSINDKHILHNKDHNSHDCYYHITMVTQLFQNTNIPDLEMNPIVDDGMDLLSGGVDDNLVSALFLDDDATQYVTVVISSWIIFIFYTFSIS